MEITPEMIKEMRDRTGLGLLEVRNALRAVDGNVGLAIEYIRKRSGDAVAEARNQRQTTAGIVESYVHMGNRVGVLIEVNCETDSVSRSSTFRNLVKELAMQVAAASPLYVTRSDIPREIISKEIEIAKAQVPEHSTELGNKKYVEGKLSRFYQTTVLLDQPYIKNTDKTILDILTEATDVLKERIIIGRFVRFQVGAAQN